MSTQTIRSAAPLILCAALGACSGGDAAPPVATPTVAVATPDVAAGRTVDVTYRFAVSPDAPPLKENYTVFVHVFDEKGDRVWTGDHEPPTPTREWKPGTVVEYVRPMVVPNRAKEGLISIDIGLYSPRSRERLPLSGRSNGMRSYRVASLKVTPRTGDPPAIFVEGWHEVESPEDAQGVEWHWSKREGRLWLRNPQRDAVLVLELDQPVIALPEPQQVEVRVATEVVDRFRLTSGPREIRRIKVPAALLGNKAVARFTIAVDKTFVPANVPQAASSDQRELGVRVFDAYFE